MASGLKIIPLRIYSIRDLEIARLCPLMYALPFTDSSFVPELHLKAGYIGFLLRSVDRSLGSLVFHLSRLCRQIHENEFLVHLCMTALSVPFIVCRGHFVCRDEGNCDSVWRDGQSQSYRRRKL
jgi:hypothetical protein